ncbi:MAG: formyltransferase family protein [Nitrosopumilaceae archaeon]
MTNPIRWIALYSYSGRELSSVINMIERRPNTIITNSDTVIDDGWYLLQIKRGMILAEYHNLFGADPDNTLITLHGWNRIIPHEICKKYTIWNIHPGLISQYPELKGKDPQKKAFELKLPSSGVTIHRATEELDSGPIIIEKEVDIQNCKEEIDVVNLLREVGINLWSKVLREKLQK